MRISKRKTVFIAVIISIVAVFIIYKIVTKPPMLMIDKSVGYKTTAENFYNEFRQNQTEFNKKYINEVIGLTGVITSVQDSIVVLNDKIVCISNTSYTDLVTDQLVKIKGKYIGYDELFDNLKLSECLLESL